MHMHKYEKWWLILGGAALVLFLSIVGINAFKMGNQPPGGHHGIDPAKVTETAPFNQTGLKKIGENKYEMIIVASAFYYDLGNKETKITVPKGATVTYKVATTDVVHGFSIAGTNANMIVEPGYVSEVTVTHNKKGVFTIVCNEYCGVGHHAMFGTLEVI